MFGHMYTVYEAMPLNAMLARVEKYTPGDGAELVRKATSSPRKPTRIRSVRAASLILFTRALWRAS